jgi:hypothetical protein
MAIGAERAPVLVRVEAGPLLAGLTKPLGEARKAERVLALLAATATADRRAAKPRAEGPAWVEGVVVAGGVANSRFKTFIAAFEI